VKPEEAIRAAETAAARKRAGGQYPGLGVGSRELGKPDLVKLREWALIEVDLELVRSTRRGGGPITWFKRLLLRVLRQYTTELEAQQTRFNVAVVAYLESLEKKD
jgi:hypothetical protein